jgi:hypothetical protein
MRKHFQKTSVTFTIGLLLFGNFEFCDGGVIYPGFVNVIPCVNTPENCARNYYQIQQNLQNDLNDAYNAAADVQASAGGLLASVQDPATGLKVVSDQLTAMIDPDNSRTNGGEYRNLPNKTTIVGITPYMYTLSQRLVNAVSKRGGDLKAAASSLKSGMDTVSKILQDAQSSANAVLQQISQQLPGQITEQSAQLRDFIAGIDQKIFADATTFDNQQSSAPLATLTGIQNALTLEATDANTTLARLQQIQNDMSNQPSDLDNYINNLMTSLQTFRAQQESAGDAQAVQKTTEFTALLVQTTAQLSQALQGILTTDRTSPYYNTSLPGYVALQRKGLDGKMTDANRTQQAQINSLITAVQQLSKSSTSVFQPILADMNSKVAQLVAKDQTFQAAAQNVIGTANATVTKTNTTFSQFSSNMDGAWNLTEGILTGQVTNISASLLNTIGNMTQQAGSEVAKLDDIMNSLASSALASDAVRQTILSNSRDQVLTYIGSNEAALNASFATIMNFMNNSQSELALINSVLSSLSAAGQQQLNQTANTIIGGIQNQTAITRNGTQQMVLDLLNKVSTNIANDQASVALLYNGLMNASQAQINQTQALLAGMQAANDAAINSTMTGLINTTALVNSAANLSASMLSTVTMLPIIAGWQQGNATALTNTIVNQANANLTALQAAIKNKFLSVQSQLQQAGSLLGSNQTALIQSLSGSLSNASAQFDSNISQMLTAFNAQLTQLQANVTLSQSQVADFSRQLTDASTAIDQANRDATNMLANDSSTTAMEAQVRAYSAKAKSDLLSTLSTGATQAKTDVSNRVTALKAAMTNLESQISSLSANVNSFNSMPQALIDQANKLQTQFGSQLTALKNSILTFSANNDNRASAFSRRANLTFGSTTTSDGRPGLQALLTTLQGAATQQAGIASTNIATARNQYANMFSSGGANLQSATNGFLATISQHRAALNATVASIINGTNAYMNTTYGAFVNNVSRLNDTVYSGYTANQQMQARLANLAAGVNSTTSQVGNMNDSAVMANLIAQYGSNVANQISALLNTSNASLSAAQAAELNRQILLANGALGTAGGINATGSSLASAVNAALAAVTSTQGQIQANTNAVKQKLQAVVAGSNSTVNLTASDIAAIIQQFTTSSSATQQAVQAQLNASGNITAQIQYAMNLWSSLKTQAMKLTEDEMDDLKATNADIIGNSTSNITAVQTRSQGDMDAVVKNATQISTNLAAFHPQNMNMLDSFVSTLNGVADQAASQKSQYDRAVSQLRGYVSNVIGQLNSRLVSISNQGPAFRSAIESSAAQDIAGLTR